MNHGAITWGAILVLSTLGGCYVSVNDEAEDDGSGICARYCAELMTCGTMPASGFETCQAGCEADFDEDEQGTSDACSCAIALGCRPASELETLCDSPSVPDPGTGGTSGGGSGGTGGAATGGAAGALPGTGGAPASGGSGGAAGAPAGSCLVDHDCAAGEDCLAGSCETRCTASCECSDGESCLEGYCAPTPAAPEPVPCEDDCGCPSGQTCVGGPPGICA